MQKYKWNYPTSMWVAEDITYEVRNWLDIIKNL